ncbi:MAG: dihydroneopterin aldolase [Actinobacteria bacterium]|nr:dihydroneopterin aldolase [Actinomycetota bacterium]
MGVHGVLPEEQRRPQPFEVDLDLHLDLKPAGASDRLEDTVDYGGLAEAVAACISGERHALLETLAERIAGLALADDRVTSVVVTVKKLEPPIPVDIDHVAVRIMRS